MKMTQMEQVIEAMRKLGGAATFGQLNEIMDFSSWETRTPEASVRRIVQTSPAFLKHRPGLWGLVELEREITNKLKLESQESENPQEYDHTYYQALTVEIGNYRKMVTYVSYQDKNRRSLGKSLKDIATLPDIYHFTYDEILKYAKTVDVIWFNERKMPYAFFEIEHSTDFLNSLSKFFELQDFHANFYIVADRGREKHYHDVISRSMFNPIRNRVCFADYDSLSEMWDMTPSQRSAAEL
jgi:hypothetical protein